MSNGPFILTQWIPDDHLLAKRNERYWDAKNVRQQEIRFLVNDDLHSAFNMYKAGQCDFLDTVPPDFVEELMKDPEFHNVPMLTVYYYGINTTKPPLDDVRVRKALSLTIDRRTICEKILKAGQLPAFSLVPPGLAGYNSQPFSSPPTPR